MEILQLILNYAIKHNLMSLVEIFVGITIVFPIVILQMRYSNWRKSRNKKTD